MTKKTFELLGRIFAAEVDGRLPYQSKSKEYPKLEEDGLCEGVTRRFGPVIVQGWILTHLGRMAYCQACPDEEPEEG